MNVNIKGILVGALGLLAPLEDEALNVALPAIAKFLVSLIRAQIPATLEGIVTKVLQAVVDELGSSAAPAAPALPQPGTSVPVAGTVKSGG